MTPLVQLMFGFFWLCSTFFLSTKDGVYCVVHHPLVHAISCRLISFFLFPTVWFVRCPVCWCSSTSRNIADWTSTVAVRGSSASWGTRNYILKCYLSSGNQTGNCLLWSWEWSVCLIGGTLWPMTLDLSSEESYCWERSSKSESILLWMKKLFVLPWYLCTLQEGIFSFTLKYSLFRRDFLAWCRWILPSNFLVFLPWIEDLEVEDHVWMYMYSEKIHVVWIYWQVHLLLWVPSTTWLHAVSYTSSLW